MSLRRLKQSECAILHTRLASWARESWPCKTPVILFRNSYGRFSPRLAFVAGRGEGVIFSRLTANDLVQHKKLGEFQKARFAIFIGEGVVFQCDRPPRENPARPLYQRGRLMTCPRA